MSDQQATRVTPRFARITTAVRDTLTGHGAMRLSRPCYDKPHRCPGWAGGGMRYPTVDRCDGGRVRVRGDRDRAPGIEPWRFGRCDTCGTVTWPYITRWLDPAWTVEWGKTQIEVRRRLTPRR